MNINEDGRRPHEWHGLEGDRWIMRDTPTGPMQLNQAPVSFHTFLCNDEVPVYIMT